MNEGVPILRPAEAAELLGVRLSKLRRLEATGRLVTVRTLGGHRRYREDDVLALRRWLERRATVSTTTAAAGAAA
jgi:excisionase family DNA binding protein